jgi:hypothetical protein
VNNTLGFRVPSALVNITYIPTAIKQKAVYNKKDFKAYFCDF